MRSPVLLRLTLVIIAVVVLQVSVLLNLQLGGVHPEIVWLLPVAAALLGGAEYGALVGFVAGFALDCMLPTPFGLSAFVGVLLGYGLGLAAERTGLAADGGVWWLVPALGFGLSIVAVLAYAAFGIVFGEDQFSSLNYLALLSVVPLGGAIFAIPVWSATAWAFGSRRGAHHARTGDVSW